MAKNAIGLSIATEEYGAKFFANGAAPSGVLEHPRVLKNPSNVRESWVKEVLDAGEINANIDISFTLRYCNIDNHMKNITMSEEVYATRR